MSDSIRKKCWEEAKQVASFQVLGEMGVGCDRTVRTGFPSGARRVFLALDSGDCFP